MNYLMKSYAYICFSGLENLASKYMRIKYLATITFFLCVNVVNGQEWFPLNAEWKYTSYGLFRDSIINTYVCQKDTIIENQICKIVARTISTCDEASTGGIRVIVKEKQGEVYFYHPDTKMFKKVYDFNKDEGETWDIPISYEYFGTIYDYGRIEVTVDSVKIVNISGYNIKKQYVTYRHYYDDDERCNKEEKREILQYIGDTDNLFPNIRTCFCDLYADKKLRCYQDGIFGQIKFIDNDCDSLVIKPIPEEEDEEESVGLNCKNILLYPNPFSSVIKIDPQKAEIKSIKVYDSIGREAMGEIEWKQNEDINLKNMPSGLYLFEISGNNGANCVLKMIKNF
ncbi:MAG: hypothetical protein DHS20C18_27600 [Saprospiraceae bacterium]|nr:MAG: hypothetical protein DHS20C18_27600 [Saprospiraceae bacterium]